MNNFLLNFGKNEHFSAFYSFSASVRGENKLVNWFYTPRYCGNVPNESDPRCYKNSFEEWIKKCHKFIREGSVAIDIGCFTGDTTLPMAHLVGDLGKVFAFDPNPLTFKEFLINKAANPNLNIIGENSAVMQDDGNYEFLYQNGGENGGPAGNGLWTTETKCYPEKATLKGINLISYLTKHNALNNISLIKSDTEGFDCYILEYIKDLIKENKPAIIIEWLPGLEPLIEHTKNVLGYESFDAENSDKIIEIKSENRIHDLLLLPKK